MLPSERLATSRLLDARAVLDALRSSSSRTHPEDHHAACASEGVLRYSAAELRALRETPYSRLPPRPLPVLPGIVVAIDAGR